MQGYEPICGESGTSGEKCLKFRRAVGNAGSHPKEALVAPELSQGKCLNLGLAAGTVDAHDQDRATSSRRCSFRRVAARCGDSVSTRAGPGRGQAGPVPYDDEELADGDLRAVKEAREEPSLLWPAIDISP
jgi:hypothetical protein